MDSKIHQNFTAYNLGCSLLIENVSKSNSNLTTIVTPNLTEYFSTFWNFSRDPLVCKQRTWWIARNLLNYLPQPPHSISWHLDKSHNFWPSLHFIELKNNLATSTWSCLLNKTCKISFDLRSKASKWTNTTGEIYIGTSTLVPVN